MFLSLGPEVPDHPIGPLWILPKAPVPSGTSKICLEPLEICMFKAQALHMNVHKHHVHYAISW